MQLWGQDAEVASPATWAIVVHFGDPLRTTRLLARLAAASPPVHVVVVDNAGSMAPLEGVEIIRPGRNLGYAGGINAGTRQALERGADYVWILNNDALPEPGTLARLLETATACGPVSLIGSLEIDPSDDDAQGPAANRAPMLPAALRGRVRAIGGRLTTVDFVSGFSMLGSRALFETVGFLDESFFHYFEDVDLCMRAILSGADVVLDCGAPVYHQRATVLGRGTERETYYFFRNRLRLAARYRGMSPIRALFVADPRHGLRPLFSRSKAVAHDWPWFRGAWRGTLDAIRRRTGPAHGEV